MAIIMATIHSIALNEESVLQHVYYDRYRKEESGSPRRTVR